MGNSEDDRIRHKNNKFNTDVVQDKFSLLLQEVSFFNIVELLEKNGYNVEFQEDRTRTILVTKVCFDNK